GFSPPCAALKGGSPWPVGGGGLGGPPPLRPPGARRRGPPQHRGRRPQRAKCLATRPAKPEQENRRRTPPGRRQASLGWPSRRGGRPGRPLGRLAARWPAPRPPKAGPPAHLPP